MQLYFLEWAGSPVLYLLLLSLGLGLCLYLFVTVKQDIFRLDRRTSRAEVSRSSAINDRFLQVDSVFEEQNQSIGKLREDLKEVTDRLMLLSPSAAPARGINLVKRTQVLQMARRGNRPDQIATCLQVPQNEVDLVLKVQRTVIKSF